MDLHLVIRLTDAESEKSDHLYYEHLSGWGLRSCMLAFVRCLTVSNCGIKAIPTNSEHQF